MSFGGVDADGAGGQSATQTVTLTDTGQLPILVSQNGITLATGTQFKVTSIVSSTQGTVNLASGPATIAAGSAESWTLTLIFDPSSYGALTDTLRIASNDPVNPTTSIALAGTGLNQPDLNLSGTSLSFPATLDDGSGGRTSTMTFVIKDVGTQVLVVAKNGLSLLAGAQSQFKIVSIVSSTQGAINLASASASLAAEGAETWTVTVASDPHSGQTTSTFSDTLQIASNDPVKPTTSVALLGQGFVPTIQAGSPAEAIHVSADRPYRISWTDTDPDGEGTISLFYSTGANPAGSLTPIATGLATTGASYDDWQVPTSLVGGTYYIFTRIDDGSVYSIGLAPGSLAVDSANTDRITSAPVVDQPSYTLTYVYKGAVITGQYSLVPGDNTLYAVTAGVTHEYHVTLVPSLVDNQSATYDALGDVKSTTDADGQTTTYTYDSLSRITNVFYPDGSTVAYTYDAASNITSMHDSTGWQFYGYDVLDRLTTVVYSTSGNIGDPTNLTISYQYDADNRLIEETYPSGEQVEYGYDNGGRLTSVTQVNAGQPNLVTTYTYNAATGLLATETLPNNIEALYSYDSSGNLIDLFYQQLSKSALIEEFQYTVDASGRRTMMVDTTSSGSTAQAYVYDDFGQLVQVTYSNNATITSADEVVDYTYDADGNRLTETTYPNGLAGGASQVLNYSYGYEDELLRVTNQNGVIVDEYSYDWRGNVVEDVTPTGTTLYTYDSQNNLVSVADGTNTIEYAYDGAGRRISETVNGVTTRYVVDPASTNNGTIEELNASGEVSASYVYGNGLIDGVLPGGSTAAFYLDNVLGSVGAITNASGTDIGNYTYDAFGQIETSPANSTNQFGFAGQQYDSVTGLIDSGARQYDPATGRFDAQDPLGPGESANLYTYAAADPVNLVDPTGLAPFTTDELNTLTNPNANVIFFAGINQDVNGARLTLSQAGLTPSEIDNITIVVGYHAGATGYPLAIGTLIQAAQAEYYKISGNVPQNLQIVQGSKQLTLQDIENQEYTTGLGFSGGGPIMANLIKSGTISVDYAATYESIVNGDNGMTEINGPISHNSTAIGTFVSGVGGLGTTNLNFDDDGIPATPSTPATQTPDDGIDGQVGDFPSPIESDPGGVLIDQAATLVNQNLKDITGAPTTPPPSNSSSWATPARPRSKTSTSATSTRPSRRSTARPCLPTSRSIPRPRWPRPRLIWETGPASSRRARPPRSTFTTTPIRSTRPTT